MRKDRRLTWRVSAPLSQVVSQCKLARPTKQQAHYAGQYQKCLAKCRQRIAAWQRSGNTARDGAEHQQTADVESIGDGGELEQEAEKNSQSAAEFNYSHDPTHRIGEGYAQLPNEIRDVLVPTGNEKFDAAVNHQTDADTKPKRYWRQV